MNTNLGEIEVVNWVDNPDGSVTLTFEVSDDFKDNLKKAFGWKRWSQKKFEQWVIECIKLQILMFEK